MATTRDEKAKQFDALLLEHDKLTREVSVIQSKFDLTAEDNKRIKELKAKMDALQRKAFGLGSY